MPIRAGFTLSLDCEGLWGMADQPHVINGGLICEKSLKDAYSFLGRVLEKYQVRATCAFVSSFAVGIDSVRSHTPLLQELAAIVPYWYANILPAIERGNTDGWDGKLYYDALRRDGHEMAWHGTTHIPLTDSTPLAAVELELQLTNLLFHELGLRPSTIVFPRNLVGHLGLLRNAGFNTYRARPPSGFVGKISSLVSEWNILDERVQEKPAQVDGWNVSPAGFFLNWPSGFRSFVPVSVTVARWKSLLRAAIERGGYVHMWFHPHNLITAPAMRLAFEEIMKEVGQRIQAGDMVSLTMADANSQFSPDLERGAA